MSEPEAGTEYIECNEIVYRALKPAWAPDAPIPADAFIRKIKRPTPDSEPTAEDAVSLSRQKYISAKGCRSKLNRMRGAASLHVGRVRALPLHVDVHPDPVRNAEGAILESHHCLLMNLPDPITDALSAETTASALIKIARFVTPEQEEDEERTRRLGTTEPSS
jgi:hypothetical protein